MLGHLTVPGVRDQFLGTLRAAKHAHVFERRVQYPHLRVGITKLDPALGTLKRIIL